MDEIFVSCSHGLESLLGDELAELGFKEITLAYCGVFVKVDNFHAVYRINYGSRLAGRVLWTLHRFNVWDQGSLYKAASTINWIPYFGKNTTFAIDANGRHPRLRNTLFAAQVVKDAICDQFRDSGKDRPSVDVKTPDLQLNLYLSDDRAILSLDTSGMPLHKRGYRQAGGEAPINESLAAGLLRLARYQGDEILCDPCCGSGTILIEAALIATKTPPGYLRRQWGFFRHPDFNEQKWLQAKNELDAARIPLTPNRLFGIERNPSTIAACKDNLRAAGFLRDVTLMHGDFRNFTPPTLPNFVITNPPHGRRLGNPEDLTMLYRDLGAFFRERVARPGRAFVFAPDRNLINAIGLTPKQRHVLSSSGDEARFMEYDLFVK